MTVIIKEAGSLFDEQADAIVNAVNCVGVSGAGIALEFKKRYPAYQELYESHCDRGEIKIGRCYIVQTGIENPKHIISFPTKDVFWKPSKIEWIRQGLQDLSNRCYRMSLKTVAMPALGCGNGDLQWDSVRSLIHQVFDMHDTVVTVFAPGAEKRKPVAETIQEVEETEEEVEGTEYDEVSAAECSECGDIILEEDVDLKDQCYECGNCGARYSRENNEGTHRCPDCNKFGYKIDGWCCPSCAGVSEAEFETYNQCPDCDGYFLPIETHTCE